MTKVNVLISKNKFAFEFNHIQQMLRIIMEPKILLSYSVTKVSPMFKGKHIYEGGNITRGTFCGMIVIFCYFVEMYRLSVMQT